MDLDDFKKTIDFEDFLSSQGYTVDKTKSSRRALIYSNGSEKILIREGNDCKTYFCLGSSDGGTIIHFLKNRPDLLRDYPAPNIYESIKKYLSNYLGARPSIDMPQQNSRVENVTYTFDPTSFSIPKEKNIHTRIFSYLKLRCNQQI